MKEHIGKWYNWMTCICSAQINNIYAGMALSVTILMIISVLLSLKIGLLLTPIVVSILGVYLISKYINIPFKIMFTNIKKYLPKDSFCAIMFGCFWTLICAVCL